MGLMMTPGVPMNMRGVPFGMSMMDCPYYRGEGICSFGCWEEPRCITGEPNEGWFASEIEWLRDMAADSRGTHGLVKHFRDLARQHAKREIRETPWG